MKHTYLLLALLTLPFVGQAQKVKKTAQTPLDKLKAEAVWMKRRVIWPLCAAPSCSRVTPG